MIAYVGRDGEFRWTRRCGLDGAVNGGGRRIGDVVSVSLVLCEYLRYLMYLYGTTGCRYMYGTAPTLEATSCFCVATM